MYGLRGLVHPLKTASIRSQVRCVALHRGDATLFVGDLPPNTSSEDLSDFMVNFAPVVEARVVGGRGYAFVTFESAADAEHVIAVTSHNPVLFHDYPLRISHAYGSKPDRQVCSQEPKTLGTMITITEEQHHL
jgi:RNA recognition motif-containing protein